METRSNHVHVGTVVLVLLAALILFIIWLSQIAGNRQEAYDIFFEQSVEGLAKGTAVTYNGVPVGAIKRIDLEERNPEFVRVRIAVGENTPVLQGTTATIRQIGFTGLSQIQLNPPEITPGRPRPGEIACPQNNPGAQCPYGVPVIRVRPGALANILNTAPELLERVSTLTERLTELLGDRNQESIAGILANTEAISRSLAERSPEIAATLAEARIAVRQAGAAADRFGQLAQSSDRLLNQEGRPLINDLRHTIRAAETSLANVDAMVADARPGVQALTKQTVPEVGQLVRDLRETTDSLREVTQRVEREGALSIVGGPKVPEYNPKKKR
jgi:phospholipid/cholesterol/gamma-HCH transport system substrate-binding protein